MLDLEALINENEFEKLKQAIIYKNVIKIKADNEILNKIYNIDKLNNHLNKNILVYPYISLNNHYGNTCKHDLIKRTKNKHINSLETKLSKIYDDWNLSDARYYHRRRHKQVPSPTGVGQDVHHARAASRPP